MTGEGHKDWLSDCDFHPGYIFTSIVYSFFVFYHFGTFCLYFASCFMDRLYVLNFDWLH